MCTKNRWLAILLIAALTIPALAITPLAGAQEGPTPEAVGLRPDAPPYALHGPYWVGARDFVIDPDSERPLTVTVWYPALNPEGLPEEITYTIFEDCAIRSMFPTVTDWSIQGHALADAAQDSSQAPYPLVVYSHGSNAWRQESAWSVEHLASMGFVVMAPDHSGEIPGHGSSQAMIIRPNDMRRVIDYAEQLTAPGGVLAGLIDAQHVGIVGWSMGGSTALAMGGARYDLAWFENWCTEHPEGDPSNLECADIKYNRRKMLSLANLTTEPEGLWPSMGDPRVQSIVDRSGAVYWYGPAGLASITIPVLVQVGSGDTDIPPQWGADLAYDNVSSAQKAMVVLNGGNHFLFENECDSMPWVTEINFYWLCTDPMWDMDQAHDLLNHFTTAFLLATLKGDTDAAAALAPGSVSFPGITYKAQGF